LSLKSGRNNGSDSIRENAIRNKIYDELDKIQAEYSHARNTPIHFQKSSLKFITSNLDIEKMENNEKFLAPTGSVKQLK